MINVYRKFICLLLVPGVDASSKFADEVKLSMISNPHDCPENLIDNLLKNYFNQPRYLRKNDVICTRITDYAPEYFYTNPIPELSKVYFKINCVKLNGRYTNEASYVVCDKSILIQEGSVNEYLPRQYQVFIEQNNCNNLENIADELDKSLMLNCPRFLEKHIETLEDCIRPFMTTNNWMNIKPVFIVDGPRGCGKHRLLTCLAKRLGFNFYNVDCAEIHTLSPSQTEAKLRIVISNAESYVPCILKLSNIESFCKNTDGKIDNRITSNFTEQLNNLYNEQMKYPLIIIATIESSKIPIDIERNFIEKITIKQLNQDDKIDIICWYLKIKKLNTNIDVKVIAELCYDLVLNDFETIILNSAKNSYKKYKNNLLIEMSDFKKSLESMQDILSSDIGSPKIPKVYWDDIGGLINLKNEIIRRIELPLLNNSGIKSSGILLYGPPGTGKTLLAKAVATECKLNFLSVKGPELLNMYVGQSEKNVRDIFERAKIASPCIIFFDELDALAPNRGRSGDSGGVMDRVVSQLLAEMDGLESSTSTFIIGATNRPDLIDSALLRPGRFDKLLYVGIYSDHQSQLSVLNAVTKKFIFANNDRDELLKNIADKLPINLTGADLQSVCSNAWLNAVKRIIESSDNNQQPKGPVVVTFDDFINAINVLVPSVTNDELDRYEKLQKQLSCKKNL